tara:strand:- start:121169 stop:121366 length:198 start_codon:yes stop_codon:yes gene_type:complete
VKAIAGRYNERKNGEPIHVTAEASLTTTITESHSGMFLAGAALHYVATLDTANAISSGPFILFDF